MSSNSNGKIILKVTLFVALPMGLLIFVLGSVVPKQMGIGKEPWNAMSIFAQNFLPVFCPIISAFYALKLVRKRREDAVDGQQSDAGGE